ncbi:MAG: hypothetical protein ACFFAS_14985 [Promethearchaeota archaeon]
MAKKYTIKDLQQDLNEGREFYFKVKAWLIILILFFIIFMVIIGVIFLFIFLFLGIFLILGGVMNILSVVILKYRKISLSPDGIRWSTLFNSHYIKYLDIEDIEYFPSAFTDQHTMKLFLYNKMKLRIRVSFLTAPKKWDGEDLIRKIVDCYWYKANPDAKHSLKSVKTITTSQGSNTPKISLINPNKSEIDSLKGYKCPNCMLIHEEKHDFCPKCGAKM